MSAAYPKTFADQMGEQCHLTSKPQRIVSLVPSQTELLFDLGLDAEVVGITKFCTHPPEKVKGVQKVGGTKKFDFEAIDALEPDLVIGNKEENYQEGIAQLKEKYPVWMSDIVDLDDALKMIEGIGQLVECEEAALKMAATIRDDMSDLPELEGKTAAYLIWQKPYMAAGSGTFIDDMLARCGVRNLYAERGRYPEITLDSLKKEKPGFVMLSTEPYPFKQKHIDELSAELPDSKLLLVDAMYFSWYGSRLLGTARYLRSLVDKLK